MSQSAYPATNAPAAQAPAASKPQSMYFVNFFVDFFFVGGASILLYLFLKSTLVELIDIRDINRADEAAAAVAASKKPIAFSVLQFISLANFLVLIGNWPHFSATNYRLYQSKENIMQYPFTAMAVPFLVFGAVLASFASKDNIAPIFIKFYLMWSSYHFCGQTVGITLIYARRAGVQVQRWERFALSGFLYATFIKGMALGDFVQDFNTIQVPGFGLPQWFKDATTVWLYISSGLLVLAVISWNVRARKMIPIIVVVPALAQLVWFVIANDSNSTFQCAGFNYLVPFFHSIQYLLIAWGLQLKEKMDREHIDPSVRYVTLETLRWWAINIAGGVFLFWLLPRIFSYPETRDIRESSFWIEGIVIAGVQVHHFFVDGVIWKLRRTTVSSPLMVNIDELIHAPLSAPVAVSASNAEAPK